MTKDGAALPPMAYTVTATQFTLLRQPTDAIHTYRIDLAFTPPFTPTAWVYLPVVLK